MICSPAGSIPAIKQITDAYDAVVFGMSDAQVQAMLKVYPALAATTLAANTYKGQSAALASVAAWNFVMVHQQMSDALAQWLLQSVFGDTVPLALHASARATRITDAASNRVVPFHLAATRFYKARNVAL
jgi:uncharacterized protein